MSAQSTLLAYEVPGPQLRLVQVLSACQLAAWRGERAVLFVADLEALARHPERAAALKDEVEALERLYRNLVGERLQVVRESDVGEAQRAYRALSGQVTVVSLLREQGGEGKDAPLTLAQLSRSLTLAAALMATRPQALLVPKSEQEEASHALALLARIESPLAVELVTSGLAGRRAAELDRLKLPTRPSDLGGVLQGLPRDPLKQGGPGRPELCVASRLLDRLANGQAERLRRGCREGAGCETCLAALTQGLEGALYGTPEERRAAEAN